MQLSTSKKMLGVINICIKRFLAIHQIVCLENRLKEIWTGLQRLAEKAALKCPQPALCIMASKTTTLVEKEV